MHFYPIDLTYEVREKKPILIFHGRDENGKRIMVEHSGFEPYFYAIVKEGAENQLDESVTNDHYITKIEECTRKIKGADRQVHRIYVNEPRATKIVKQAIKEKLHGAYEYDILYTRRFLIDRKITLFTKTPFEGNVLEETNEYIKYDATRIGPSNEDDTYDNVRALALDIETYAERGKPINMKEYPILMIALYGEGYQKCFTWKNADHPDAIVCQSEADMLDKVCVAVREFDPDIVTGYHSDGFDFPYLQARAKKLKQKLEMGVGGSELRIRGREYKVGIIDGMVHIDLFQFVRKVMRTSLETDTLKLDAVCKELLGVQKKDVDILALAKHWDANDDLAEYIDYNIQDVRITHQLFDKIFPNIIELMKTVGVSLFDVSRFSFSQSVEWYLIRRATNAAQIVPNKPGYNEQQRRGKEHVKGGFVYSPTPGLYDTVITYDFRSLYPSIIASHNISPETITSGGAGGIKGVYGTHNFRQDIDGFISGAISDLIRLRAVLKKELKEKKDDPLLQARSIALKLLANSMYGYLGFSVARWYSIQCADATTSYGRKYVNDVIDEANAKGFKVVYGDTDSAMLLLGDKTREDAVAFCDYINDKLPGMMELEVESFYPRALFVATKGSDSGAKKKYAMIDDEGHLKIRGFETVRRNWSPVAKDLQKHVLDILLREGNVDKAADYVKGVISDLKAHKIPIAQVTILTQLSRALKDYSSRGPHVVAAERMQARGEEVGSGTYIEYVVSEGSGLVRDRVCLPDEKEAQNYDTEYYITHQVIPSVDRIFDAVGYDVDRLLGKGGQTSLGDW